MRCIAFPIVAFSLFGPNENIPVCIILESFIDYLVYYEAQTLKKAFQAKHSSQQLASELIFLMSRHGYVDIPKPGNLRSLVVQVARHKLMVRVLRANHPIHSGVPQYHQSFWARFSVTDLYLL